ncbi:MAG: hypothetical protein COV47_03995 [Candidatus Diapherotrites archaeon CG11_big_fil_rev_8_21_14_0_20_37_9]|nr:MAG: hypothetical protein COV47_03995 [Candidatus Diapherotrites archaeon CG11_big_fil_rev_8_21_14_0_20_37_9]
MTRKIGKVISGFFRKKKPAGSITTEVLRPASVMTPDTRRANIATVTELHLLAKMSSDSVLAQKLNDFSLRLSRTPDVKVREDVQELVLKIREKEDELRRTEKEHRLTVTGVHDTIQDIKSGGKDKKQKLVDRLNRSVKRFKKSDTPKKKVIRELASMRLRLLGIFKDIIEEGLSK